MKAVVRARAVRRAARAPGADRAGDHRAARRPTTRCLRQPAPEDDQLGVRPRGDPALRLRLRARPAGPDAPSVHDQVLARRRAHHHARARERPHRRAVQHAARVRSRACTSRASAWSSRARRSPTAPRPACTRASRACGRTWSAAAAASGSTSTRSCSGASRSSCERVPLDTFYRAINKVERSLIRTDADEVTYNLHVMIRFDLELRPARGPARDRGPARGVARALRARPRASRAPDDRDGVLQDVHWFAGADRRACSRATRSATS